MKRGEYDAVLVLGNSWRRIKARSMVQARARAADWARGLDHGGFWRAGLDHGFVRVVVIAWDGARSTDVVRVDPPA